MSVVLKPITSPILGYDPGQGTPSGGGTSGGQQIQGQFYYWPNIIHLSGGIAATDLDAQDISVLPDNALIQVSIPGRGGSQWLRVKDGTSPTTDLNKGVIRPINYDVVLRPYILNRYMGF